MFDAYSVSTTVAWRLFIGFIWFVIKILLIDAKDQGVHFSVWLVTFQILITIENVFVTAVRIMQIRTADRQKWYILLLNFSR